MAEDIVQRLVKYWESNSESIIFARLGDELYNSGRRDEALEVLTTGIAKHPTYATGYIVLSKILMDIGRYEEAENITQTVLQLDPCNQQAYMILADIGFKERELETGINNLMNILWLNPENVMVKDKLNKWRKELMGEIEAQEEEYGSESTEKTRSVDAQDLSPAAEELVELTESIYAQDEQIEEPDEIDIQLPDTDQEDENPIPESIDLSASADDSDEFMIKSAADEVQYDKKAVSPNLPELEERIDQQENETEIPEEITLERFADPNLEESELDKIINEIDSEIESKNLADNEFGDDEEDELHMPADTGGFFVETDDMSLSDGDDIVIESGDDLRLSDEEADTSPLLSLENDESQFSLPEEESPSLSLDSSELDSGFTDIENEDSSLTTTEGPPLSEIEDIERQDDLSLLAQEALESLSNLKVSKDDLEIESDGQEEKSPPIPKTSTMAEIFVEQGKIKEAINIYKNLLSVVEDEATQDLYRKRITELSELTNGNGY